MSVESVLVIAFGQSNADVHDAGPRLASPWLDDPRLVVPNDGFGFRGPRGLDRAAITGFEPLALHDRKAMSLLGAVGARILHDLGGDAPARVILRSAAKGGRRFCAIAQAERQVEGILFAPDGGLSPLFEDFLRTVTEICAVSAAEGQPVRAICPVFVHGESDRSLEGAAYLVLAEEMLDRTAAALAPLGLPIHWFMVQPGGTGSRGGGNDWPNRDALVKLACRRPDVTMAAAAYPYPLHDEIHYSARGKALLGEVIGRAIGRWLRGDHRDLPRLARVHAEGRTLRLEFDTPNELEIDPDPACGWHGFSLRRGTIRSVRAMGREVMIELEDEAPPEGLAYAHASRREMLALNRPAPSGHAFGGGALRLAGRDASILLPGETLHDWVPGFRL